MKKFNPDAVVDENYLYHDVSLTAHLFRLEIGNFPRLRQLLGTRELLMEVGDSLTRTCVSSFRAGLSMCEGTRGSNGLVVQVGCAHETFN